MIRPNATGFIGRSLYALFVREPAISTSVRPAPSPRKSTLVEPSDEVAIRQWYELRCAVVHADLPADPPPCWIHELGSVRHPWPGEVATVWVARVDGSVVGGCLLNLPTLDL